MQYDRRYVGYERTQHAPGIKISYHRLLLYLVIIALIFLLLKGSG